MEKIATFCVGFSFIFYFVVTQKKVLLICACESWLSGPDYHCMFQEIQPMCGQMFFPDCSLKKIKFKTNNGLGFACMSNNIDIVLLKKSLKLLGSLTGSKLSQRDGLLFKMHRILYVLKLPQQSC